MTILTMQHQEPADLSSRLAEHLKTAVWYWEANLPADAGPTELEELAAAKTIVATSWPESRSPHDPNPL